MHLVYSLFDAIFFRTHIFHLLTWTMLYQMLVIICHTLNIICTQSSVEIIYIDICIVISQLLLIFQYLQCIPCMYLEIWQCFVQMGKIYIMLRPRVAWDYMLYSETTMEWFDTLLCPLQSSYAFWVTCSWVLVTKHGLVGRSVEGSVSLTEVAQTCHLSASPTRGRKWTYSIKLYFLNDLIMKWW